MAPFCRERGVHLLAYGTVCGGLLSERFLGQPEPRASALDTVSLQKYKRMVDAWGGWALFQELLAALREVAAATAWASRPWPCAGCSTVPRWRARSWARGSA